MIKKAIINKITLLTNDGEVIIIEHKNNGSTSISDTSFINEEDMKYISELTEYMSKQVVKK